MSSIMYSVTFDITWRILFMTIAEQLRQQGEQQGEVKLFLELLEYRFGPISPDYKDRIRKADPNILLQWGKKIFEAKTLKDILN